MIKVENLYKTFNGKAVIKGFNGIFEKGKITFIIGESGSGKTTIVKCMVGLLIPDAGRVLYDGTDMISLDEKDRAKIRQQIGFVFQGGALFDSLTVEENIMFPLKVFTNMSIKEMKERVRECLAMVNLKDIEDRYPSQLSGGMRKRVAIARGIVTNPKYLFFDEPTSGLDPVTSRKIDMEIRQLVDKLQTTTVIISHDVQSVIEIADKVMFIHEGEKKWEGTPSEIFNATDTFLQNFLKNSILVGTKQSQ